MANITAVTVAGTSAQARPVLQRRYLGIFNQSTSATVYVAFDTAAAASATAGQITLLPVTGANKSFVEWSGDGTPQNAIFMIASAGSTPATVVEA